MICCQTPLTRRQLEAPIAGKQNHVDASGAAAVIGGFINQLKSNPGSVAVGGNRQTAVSGAEAVSVGGRGGLCSGTQSVVVGCRDSDVSGINSVAVGGWSNRVLLWLVKITSLLMMGPPYRVSSVALETARSGVSPS